MVLRDDIAAAYQRLVEQASSDEHMLGALPEDASQPLLDWQLARLEVAARSSTSDAELHQRADAIRATAHSIADAAAADGDDGVAMRARLHAFDADEDRPIEGASAPPNANAPTAAVTSPPLTTPADQPSVTGEPESLRDTESADLVEPARPQPTRRRWVIAGIAAAGLALVLAVIAVVSCRGRSEQPDAVDAPPAGDGWYEALFTTPQRTGTPAAGSSGRLDERLVREIDAARRSVDIAVYDFGLDNVADALIRAKQRGVPVRIVTDSDNAENPALVRVERSGIPVVLDDRSALMHHKFAVFDAERVMTGAWNFAERDTFRHNNNSIVWQSPELARNFTNEFDKMFTGRRFGPRKPTDVPNPVVEHNGTRVETHFASETKVIPLIAERLRRAQSSIAFMAFTFTQDDLGAILRDKDGMGVGVWGVFEATGSQTAFSEYTSLKTMRPVGSGPPFPGCSHGPAVVTDGNPFLMHHKVFVIDERTVIYGSFNFTANAADDNDEALLIVDNPALARQFLAEFCRVYNAGVDRNGGQP